MAEAEEGDEKVKGLSLFLTGVAAPPQEIGEVLKVGEALSETAIDDEGDAVEGDNGVSPLSEGVVAPDARGDVLREVGDDEKAESERAGDDLHSSRSS